MHKSIHSVFSAGVFLLATVSHADITERTVNYKEGSTKLEGFLAYDDQGDLKKPVVILVHEWDGLGDYIKARAKQVAALGYIAFAADIYGKGIRAKTPEESGKLASIYKKNRSLTRARVRAAMDEALKLGQADASRVAVMGYCFGGMVSLELARSGAPIVGAITLHGDLSNPNPADDKNIRAKILVLHGANDPAVDLKAVRAFEDEMQKTKVDWQAVLYSGAVHAFTNPAHKDAPAGSAVAYNQEADQRSWAALKDFLAEVFLK